MKITESYGLRHEDWAALEQFDRNTGNILKYDKETGQLDQVSRKILRETNILKRLIDNGMILPGGWMTSTGLKECETRLSLMEKTLGENAGSLLNNSESLKGKLSTENNSKQRPNNFLSPQAEKFLKSLWNNNMLNPFEPKKTVIQNEKNEISRNAESGVSSEEKQEKDIQEPSPDFLCEENPISKYLITFLNPHSFEAEQFKILRTHIFFPLSGKIPRIIAVTSSVPGEGKSFVSANLAVSIAKEIDRHVLLIDCDLRKPKIHKYFGFKNNLPGLSEHLSQKTELSSLLLKTKVNKLTILPAGPPAENPSELLSSEHMASMLKEVSQRYSDRLVILDTTPVTITAESVTLTRYVDGVLLVVRHGYTLKSHLKDLVKMIDHEKIIGTVLNDVDMRSLTQYEYKKYIKKYYYNKKK
jgi:exopolysaccharide/PEP-CTERM locus tyrosine autokinase